MRGDGSAGPGGRQGADLQPTNEDERRKRERATQLRFAGLGLEFAGGLAAFVLVGWWIDSRFGTSPTWLVTMSILGAIGGLYHLIRSAFVAQKRIERSQKRSADGQGQRDDDQPSGPTA